MMKRILALLLVLTMVIGYAPISVGAEGDGTCALCHAEDCTGEHPNWCYTCEAEPCKEEQAHPICGECGKIGCVDHTETPAEPQNEADDSDAETPAEENPDSQEQPESSTSDTASTVSEDSTSDNTAETAGETDTTESDTTETEAADDVAGTEEGDKTCQTCGKENCASDHAAWCAVCKQDECGKTHTVCEHCEAVDCTAEHVACEKCGEVDCGKDHAAWCDICKQDECGKTHTVCEHCKAVDCTVNHICKYCEAVDCTAEHIVCQECQAYADSQEALNHKETCSAYEAPAEEEEKAPKVGDKIWIKSGSKVYKSASSKKGYTLMGSYEVEITKVITDENGKVIAYHFNFTKLGIGEAALSMGGYKYVMAEDTTTVKPDDAVIGDETACTCGAEDGVHSEECPLYTNVTGTFTVDGVDVVIDVAEGVFPEGTSVTVTPVKQRSAPSGSVLLEPLEAQLTDCTLSVLSAKIMDITFMNGEEEVQPNGTVQLTFDVPVSEIISGADVIAILHMNDSGKADLMAYQKVVPGSGLSITVDAESFSHYVVLQSETRYASTLMRDKLSGNSRYSIVTFPVTLNDFDAVAYNNAYGSEGLWFTTGTAGTGMNLGALPATVGIVADNLSANGYPVTRGADRGEILFSPNGASGKTPYPNVNFEFIYDSQTGYYTYNSGANHAQYNQSRNTVELYADTLAPFNYRYDVLSAITANTSYASRRALSNGNVQITVNTKSGSHLFRVTDGDLTNLDTDNYTHAYLRLKPSFTGTVRCRVFYSSSGDSNYDDYELSLQAGTWNDCIFGPFDANKKVYHVRFYAPSAAAGSTMEIDTAGFLQTVNGTEVNFAGLYPFNTDITRTYAGSASFDMATWENRILTGTNAELMSSRVMFNKLFDGNGLSDPYVYFSLATEIDFYIPEGNQVNGQDIIFQFNGDDDMWVFVDGKLALDIGGAHTHIEGTVNFTNGNTYVENVRSLTDTTLTGNGASYGKLAASQFEPGYHKMKVFYMERAGTNSNCLIKFNMPVVPTGNVVVEKIVKEENGYPIEDDLTFTFQASAKNKNGEAIGIMNNKSFVVATMAADGTLTRQNATTSNTGTFTLKHNQTAYFNDIPESTTVTVKETQPVSAEHTVYKSTTLNGKTTLQGSGTTTANDILSFSYVNTYEAIRDTDIVIHKTANGVKNDVDAAENQSFIFHVKGNDADNKHIDMMVTVNITSVDGSGNGTGSVTIKNVPVGSYTVTEVTDWSWRYLAAGSELTQMAQYPMAESNHFRFANTRSWIYWLSGDNFNENQFTVKSVSGS